MHQNPETPKRSKADSSRINGSKSTGATTEAGKLRAANGNLKHGAYSSRVLMDGENAEALAILQKCFNDVFQPEDPFEAELVVTLADTRWRIRRLEASESAQLNNALLLQKAELEKSFDQIDPRHQRSFAVDSRINAIDAYTRVEERLHRIYDRTHRLLAKHRRDLGRKMPAVHVPSHEVSQATERPECSNPPDVPPGVQSPAASIIGKVAMIFLIFASFLLPSVRFQIATASQLRKSTTMNEYYNLTAIGDPEECQYPLLRKNVSQAQAPSANCSQSCEHMGRLIQVFEKHPEIRNAVARALQDDHMRTIAPCNH